MKMGAEFTKHQMAKKVVPVGSKAKPEKRFFQLSSDDNTISWTGGNPEKNRVRVYDIREIRIGQSTSTFVKVANEKKLQSKAGVCFSIIYGHNYKEVNLLALSTPVYTIWTRGLKHLLARPRVRSSFSFS